MFRRKREEPNEQLLTALSHANEVLDDANKQIAFGIQRRRELEEAVEYLLQFIPHCQVLVGENMSNAQTGEALAAIRSLLAQPKRS